MLFYTEKHSRNRTAKILQYPYKYFIIIKDSLSNILQKHTGENSPISLRVSTGKRAAFYTLPKASFTVETAIVLPLFLLSVLALFSMLDFYRIYTEERMELIQKAKKTAVYAYMPGDSPSVSDLFPNGYVTLSKIVNYQIPFVPFPLPRLQIACHARVHAWCGYLGTEEEGAPQKSKEMVYVTDYESVYHTDPSCSHLDLQIFESSLSEARKARNKNGARYAPCEKCIGSGNTHSLVYLSDHGTAYHNSPNCSGLKRTIHLIPLEDTGGLNICSRCGQSQNRKEIS